MSMFIDPTTFELTSTIFSRPTDSFITGLRFASIHSFVHSFISIKRAYHHHVDGRTRAFEAHGVVGFSALSVGTFQSNSIVRWEGDRREGGLFIVEKLQCSSNRSEDVDQDDTRSCSSQPAMSRAKQRTAREATTHWSRRDGLRRRDRSKENRSGEQIQSSLFQVSSTQGRRGGG